MSITINDTTFSTIEDAQKYIEDNNLCIESYIDLDSMFKTNSTLIECEIINPENTQHLISVYIDADDVEYEKAKIELTLTNNYYRYRNTLADQIYRLEPEEISQDLIDLYNVQVKNFNKYGLDRVIVNADEAKKIIEINSILIF